MIVEGNLKELSFHENSLFSPLLLHLYNKSKLMPAQARTAGVDFSHFHDLLLAFS
jgi:hypothetical protein